MNSVHARESTTRTLINFTLININIPVFVETTLLDSF